MTERPENSGAEMGDIVACDGKVGRVIDFDEGKPVIQPFREKPLYLATEAFTATGEAKVLEKHWQRDSRDQDNER